jgi:hypothetical protein
MYTAHAQTRSQQRSISPEVVDALLAYGELQRRSGADVYYLTKRSRARAAAAMGAHYQRLERHLNSYLVLADDGAIVTVGHRYRRLKF